MLLKVKRLFADARLPERANSTDSGADVFIYRFEKYYGSGGVTDISTLVDTKQITLNTNDRVLINTGIAATVGPGYEIEIRPRSGNALRKGLIVVNSPGTIDESYRGFIGVIVANIGHEPQELKIGDKIAQMKVSRVEVPLIVEVNEFDETKRGTGGFGSTGT